MNAMMYRLFLALIVVLLVSAPAAFAQAPGLEVGASLPYADAALVVANSGTVGASTTLQSLIGAKGLAVIFWSNTCPWVSKYEQRVLDLAAEYQRAGVNFVVVNANDPVAFPEESVSAMRERATSKDYPFPYVVDEGSILAQAFGAGRTPEVYLFNPGGTLIYQGTVDDTPTGVSVETIPYFRNALNEHIAGQPVKVQKTKAFGCTIKFY